IAAGNSLTVYAITRDAVNNLVANAPPDSWSLVGITGGVAAGDLVANGTGVSTDFSVSGRPQGIAASPDGSLWFTEPNINRIGRITTAGVVTEFPTVVGTSYGIVAGPDGNIWFAEDGANKIGQITPAGVVSEFVIPTVSSNPFGIAAGPDGSLWFTEQS